MPSEGVAASMRVSDGVGGIVDGLVAVDVLSCASVGTDVESDIARARWRIPGRRCHQRVRRCEVLQRKVWRMDGYGCHAHKV